jgi:hypothetical protein
MLFQDILEQVHSLFKDWKGEKNIAKKDMEEIRSDFSLLSSKRLAIYLSYTDIESITIANHRK